MELPRLESFLRTEVFPERRTQFSEALKSYGACPLPAPTLDQAVSGAQGEFYLISMISDVSPAEHGPVIHQTPVKDLLPFSLSGFIAWVFTGRSPTEDLVEEIDETLVAPSSLPEHFCRQIAGLAAWPFPKLLSAAVSALEECGSSEDRQGERWVTTLRSGMSFLSQIRSVIAYLLDSRRELHGEEPWAAGFFSRQGASVRSSDLTDFAELWTKLNACHDIGFAMAHAAAIAYSAGASIEEALAAGGKAFSGAKHGLAIFGVFDWVADLESAVQNGMTAAEYCRTAIRERKVPGCGHVVLRTEDRRFIELLAFARARANDRPLTQLIDQVSRTLPREYAQLFPDREPLFCNVDMAAPLFRVFGVDDPRRVFALAFVAYSIGIIADSVWREGIGFNRLIRPNTFTLERALALFETGVAGGS